MSRLILAILLPLAGCAWLDPPDSLERQAATLHAPDMEAVIRAAKPGVPRELARAPSELGATAPR